MLNISPIGRNCSREERNAFEEFDLKNGIRATMVEKMKEEVRRSAAKTKYNSSLKHYRRTPIVLVDF